jgi:hypothetical protein
LNRCATNRRVDADIGQHRQRIAVRLMLRNQQQGAHVVDVELGRDENCSSKVCVVISRNVVYGLNTTFKLIFNNALIVKILLGHTFRFFSVVGHFLALIARQLLPSPILLLMPTTYTFAPLVLPDLPILQRDISLKV